MEKSFYEGDTLNGKKHGFGIIKTYNDTNILVNVFEGEFFEGMRHGIGLEIFHYNNPELCYSLHSNYVNGVKGSNGFVSFNKSHPRFTDVSRCILDNSGNYALVDKTLSGFSIKNLQ